MEEKIKAIVQWVKTILSYKVCRWIFSSTIGLIALPLTFLILTISLYPDLFQAKTSHKFEWYKLESYYNFFDENKNSKTPSSHIECPQDTSQYYHILFIDRTLSTLSFDRNKELSYFRHYLEQNLSEKNYSFIPIIENRKDFSTIDLLYLRVFQELIESEQTNGITVAFFDGVDVFTSIFYGASDQQTRRKFIESLIRKPSRYYSQKTDFVEMFERINRLCAAAKMDSRKIILTIISDFVHENTEQKEVFSNVVESFNKKNTNIIQYNIIYSPPSEKTLKDRSDRLVEKIINQVDGIDNLINMEYVNSNFNEFENVLLRCSSPIIADKKDNLIHFYFHNFYETAQAKITLPKNVNLEWRIRTIPNEKEEKNYFVFYTTNDNKNKLLTSNWYSLNSEKDNVLFLNIRLNRHTDIEQYKLEIRCGNKFGRYDIALHELIPPLIANLGLRALDLLCICILLIVFSGSILLIRFIEHNIFPRISNGKFWVIIAEMVFFIILLIGILICTWECVLTSIAIVFCLLLILFYLAFSIYRKKYKFGAEETFKKVEKEKINYRENIVTKEGKTRMVNFLTILITLFLTSILSIISASFQLFKNDVFQIFFWVVGLIVILFLSIGFFPKLLRWLSSIPTDKETRLKNKIISVFSESLDKTILNPNNKKNAVL